MVGLAAYVLWMGAMRLMAPIELATTLMLLAAAGGIATELVALWLLHERQKGNLNMQGAFWHIVQTFVGSFIIIVAALVIASRHRPTARDGLWARAVLGLLAHSARFAWAVSLNVRS